MVRPQSRFEGSDRQGRGRLLDALRLGAVARDEVADRCGWPDDVARAERIASSLVSDGFARWRTEPSSCAATGSRSDQRAEELHDAPIDRLRLLEM